MPCEARSRRMVKPLNWHCTGIGIVQILPGGALTPPSVVPESEAQYFRDQGEPYDVVPFVGGDHYHVVLPELSTAEAY